MGQNTVVAGALLVIGAATVAYSQPRPGSGAKPCGDGPSWDCNTGAAAPAGSIAKGIQGFSLGMTPQAISAVGRKRVEELRKCGGNDMVRQLKCQEMTPAINATKTSPGEPRVVTEITYTANMAADGSKPDPGKIIGGLIARYGEPYRRQLSRVNGNGPFLKATMMWSESPDFVADKSDLILLCAQDVKRDNPRLPMVSARGKASTVINIDAQAMRAGEVERTCPGALPAFKKAVAAALTPALTASVDANGKVSMVYSWQKPLADFYLRGVAAKAEKERTLPSRTVEF